MENVRYQKIARMFNEIIERNASNMYQSDLASLLGIKQPTISRIKKGEVLPPDIAVSKIAEMWGIDISEEVKQARIDGSRISQRGTRTPKKSFDVGVPYYDVDFIGGFDIVIDDQSVNPDYLINFKPYEKATCWCNITGHSMEPEISHGDIIALRKIEDWSFIPFGEIYAIVTHNDMRTVKRLAPGSTKDKFTMVPANKSPEYAPQEIDRKDIRYIYEVMGCMKKF